jgi:hypothetical protein
MREDLNYILTKFGMPLKLVKLELTVIYVYANICFEKFLIHNYLKQENGFLLLFFSNALEVPLLRSRRTRE